MLIVRKISSYLLPLDRFLHIGAFSHSIQLGKQRKHVRTSIEVFGDQDEKTGIGQIKTCKWYFTFPLQINPSVFPSWAVVLRDYTPKPPSFSLRLHKVMVWCNQLIMICSTTAV